MRRQRVLELPSLVLNKSFQPVRITTVREACALLFGDRAYAMDGRYEPMDFAAWAAQPATGGALIPTPSLKLRAPRLLLLREYNKVPRTPLRLSRKNIYLRDGGACGYCGSKDELTLDHVLPRSRGGPSTWENLVTCCRPCNTRKGRKTPSEAGMHLGKEPKRPSWNVALQIASLSRTIPQWEPFLASLR